MSSSLRAAQALRATRATRAPRRFASTTQQAQQAASKASETMKTTADATSNAVKNAAGNAKEAAADAAGTAQQKATDYAQVAMEYGQKALDAGRKALGPIGARVGNALGGYREPIVYNLTVVRELAKQVYVAERLAPPTSLNTVANAYGTMWSRASNPQYWVELTKTGEWKKVGVYALEAYGIYKVGEIIGRRSLIGYSTH